MKLFSQIEHKSIHMAPGEKIIPAKSFSQLKEASELLAETQKEIEELMKKTVQECEEAKALAKEAGFQEGLQQLNLTILQVNRSFHELSEEMEKKIFPIAIKAAKKILGEELELHPDRIASIIAEALKPVAQHLNVVIYVNRDDLQRVEKERPRFKKILKQAELSIQVGPDVKKGGCLIKTEKGMINAEIDTQFKALKAAFDRFSEKKRSS